MRIRISCLAIAALLAACGSDEAQNVPGDTANGEAFSGIADDAVLHLTGTEPFWGGTVRDETFTYSTPEDMEGTQIAVTRFAGRGGLSFSGELEGRALDLAITPAECSDGMSDRTYPFVATLQLGTEQREGCAWLESAPPGAGDQ